MNKAILAALMLGATGLGLSACDGGATAPAQEETAGVPGMTITNGRMVLSAVPGNPAAVYFDLDYEGDDNLALSRASVKGAKSAMFHDYSDVNGQKQMMEMLPLPIKKGDKIKFEPGGKHIMAMDPSPDLKPGGTTDVTVFVSGGDSQTFTVPIKAAGDER